MTLSNLAKRVEKLITDNSPVILTAIGVAGTITTAYLTGKASFKAAEILDHERNYVSDSPGMLELREKVNLTWKLYIPAIGTGILTCACIVGANRIGSRRAAAMAAAYSLSERAFSEYKEKVVERIGDIKEQKIRDEIAQDRVYRNPVSSREVIITGNGDVLCYDSITGRYFNSNVESIRKAVNDTNHQILNDMYASLNDFYQKIGLPMTPYANEVGWNVDRLLEINFSTVLSEDGRPCISLDYPLAPIRECFRLQ